MKSAVLALLVAIVSNTSVADTFQPHPTKASSPLKVANADVLSILKVKRQVADTCKQEDDVCDQNNKCCAGLICEAVGTYGSTCVKPH